MKRERRKTQNRRWSDVEKQYLRDNYASMTRMEMATKLARTERSIAGQMQCMNLLKHPSPPRAPNRPWSEVERSFVLDNYQQMTAKEMARKLGRSERSVAKLMDRQKLKKKPAPTRQRPKLKKSATKIHGMSKTRLYRIWNNMKTRCDNPSYHGYRNYGGRGITVCPEWNNSFIEFCRWAKTSGYQPHLTIDRIQNDGPYEPRNCRWLTNSEQQKNRQRPPSSRFTGVCLNGRKWVASIKINGCPIYLGYFDSEEAAAAEYDRAVIENNLDRPLNFPPKNKAA